MPVSNKSVNARILKFLQNGGNITTNQARTKFGITNVSARISELNKAGYSIYANKRTTDNGKKILVYQLGSAARRTVIAGQLILADPYFANQLETAIQERLRLV